MSCLPHNNTKVTETHSSISRRHFVQLLLNSHYFLFDTHISTGLFLLYTTSKRDELFRKHTTQTLSAKTPLCSQHGTRNRLIRSLPPLNSTNNKSAKPTMSYTIDHIIDKVGAVPVIIRGLHYRAIHGRLERLLAMAQSSNANKIERGYVSVMTGCG